MRQKDQPGASGFGDGKPRRLTPLEVQQKEFRVSLRGYNEREVDEFLDAVTEELQRYEAEVMRLRSSHVADPGSLDLDAEGRRIIDDARSRADAIVREAEARAAGIPTASGTETRAVVAPYLNREREFLQSLGSLVQDHAQMIKTMVEEARRRTEPEPAETAATAGTVSPATTAVGPAPAVAEGSPASGEAAPETAEKPSSDPTEPEVVVLGGAEETVPAAAERAGEDREPEGARSLRELFWGED